MATILEHPASPPEVDTRPVRAARRGPARRTTYVVVGLSALLLFAFAARVLLGDFTYTVSDFFRILFGDELASVPGARYILMEEKLPRAVLAVLVGVSFGLGGAIFQTTLRNPLASPDIIGVSFGASACAVIAIVVVGLSDSWVALSAVGGAIVVSVIVRLVAGQDNGYRLVLVGIGLAAALQSVVQYVFTRADEYDMQKVLLWLVGSVSRANWEMIRVIALVLVVLVPLTAWLASSLRITELGSDTAAGLGVPAIRGDLLLLLAVVLVAVGVAGAGPVAFVSFLAGPIARALNRGRTTLLGAALVGAVIVLAADYVADYLILDINFPVGVVTGAFGAPFLLWLLATGRTGRRA
ncbi:iron ABC transporter permease [Nocardioides sp. AE5]|uniref:FecCD family ABC transporter permease n=1 Tax=Nocardioides sp. AE5 TaxID=2962573 RepID=UPI00288201E3|nr:iron ABC transporter permease [Nocardioides sp. AE5]MDT0203478.1 iron ABC transporter permease [Nocardioides sp. AE5]